MSIYVEVHPEHLPAMPETVTSAIDRVFRLTLKMSNRCIDWQEDLRTTCTNESHSSRRFTYPQS
jgi:hypothetical protein